MRLSSQRSADLTTKQVKGAARVGATRLNTHDDEEEDAPIRAGAAVERAPLKTGAADSQDDDVFCIDLGPSGPLGLLDPMKGRMD